MHSDSFTPSQNEQNNQKGAVQDSNFFLQPQQIVLRNKSNSKEQIRHLNDYDLNILEDEAYQDVSDEVFKLEYRISRIENDINKIEERISAATEINDAASIINLESEKSLLMSELDDMYDIYKEMSLSAKISGGVSNNFRQKLNFYKIKLTDATNKLLSKFSVKLSSLLVLKQSLKKLENISKNVDDLVSMQIPYGESSEKYAQLSKYILKANNIQSSISKHIK
ncbi:hypothetical protein IKQ21_01830 [bacterium]|nr:hypothetical protein [bacterium]